MKTKQAIFIASSLLIGILLTLAISFLFAQSAVASTAGQPAAPVTVNAGLPVIADFETGGVGSWFTYGDGGSSIVKSVIPTNTIATMGVVSNTVMKVDYVSAGWGVGTGKDTVPFQDWSAYDGLSFWFRGTNSGTVFTIILTDNAGERIATKFTDTSSSWRELTFPWQVFYHDTGYQPGGAPNDGPTLTAVEAFAFAPASPSSGTYYMDQVKLFKNTGTVVSDFQSGGVGSWFTYGDGGSSIVKSVIPTNTIATMGVVSNTVMKVDYVSAGWGVGTGKDTVPFQDWSAYDGLSFWFRGTNSGTVFTIILTDNAGERIATKFTDTSSSWRELTFPWQVFYHDTGYQPGGAPNDGPTLTAVEAFAFAPASPSSGTYYMDQVKLFKNTGTVVSDFQTGGVGSWFTYGDGGSSIVKSVIPTNTIATMGVVSNTVMKVDYVSAGWGVGTGKDTVPFQDWSAYDGLSFWFRGTNSGTVFTIILTDNAGERIATKFTDTSSSWRELTFPWQVFYHDTGYQPGGAPNDGPTLTAVEAFAFAPASPSSGTYYMDQVKLFTNAASTKAAPKASFSSASYSVAEGGTATITVSLDISSTQVITVSYATSNGTAVAGTDYTAASGKLELPANTLQQSFTISTNDNSVYSPDKTINLTLSDPVNADLGSRSQAKLTIINDEPAPNSLLIDNYEAGLVQITDGFNNKDGYSVWGSTTGNVAITVTTVAAGDPLALPGQTGSNKIMKITSNVESWGGFTDAFTDGTDWTSQDWTRYDGIRFWYYGTNKGNQIQFEIFDNRELGNSGDSAERYYYRFDDNFTGWRQISIPFALFQRRTDYQPGGAPDDGLNLTDVSGFAMGLPAITPNNPVYYYIDNVELYGDLSKLLPPAKVGLSANAYSAIEGQPINVKFTLNETQAVPITVTYVITSGTAKPGADFVGIATPGTVVFNPGQLVKTLSIQTLNNSSDDGNRQFRIGLTGAVNTTLGWKTWAPAVIRDDDPIDPYIIDAFTTGIPLDLKSTGNAAIAWKEVLSGTALTLPGQDPINGVLVITNTTAGGLVREFQTGQDWSIADGLSFWVYGTGSGKTITTTIFDNPAADPGPSQWTLAWSDEFFGAAGSAPNPAYWGYDIGGGGFGNNEWEYYTDSRANSAIDGNGNLVITATTNTDTSLKCSTSPNGDKTCFATSARLITANKIDFTYGRVEARIKIPKGQGIWPAFWMLGSDIATNPWPACGEIDILENIGKTSDQTNVHGTVHGPGYSGGSGIGATYNTGITLADDFHVYAIEWEPTVIRWYIDGYNYFTVTNTTPPLPNGTDWVFDHPFFIIMNLAVGGNWPGYPDGTTLFPQNMVVDYVRVSQSPDTAERFEASFQDNFTGWHKVILPWSAFKRSANQPTGAPNDGLTLTKVMGYQLDFPAASKTGLAAQATNALTYYLDQIKLIDLFTIYFPFVSKR